MIVTLYGACWKCHRENTPRARRTIACWGARGELRVQECMFGCRLFTEREKNDH